MGRAAELKKGASELIDGLAAKPLDEVEALKSAADSIEEMLMGKETHKHLMVQSSAAYLEQILRRVEAANARIAKAAEKRAEVEGIQPQLQKDVQEASSELERVTVASQALKASLDASLSAHFKTSFSITEIE